MHKPMRLRFDIKYLFKANGCVGKVNSFYLPEGDIFRCLFSDIIIIKRERERERERKREREN
jgi:hypothetical protein